MKRIAEKLLTFCQWRFWGLLTDTFLISSLKLQRSLNMLLDRNKMAVITFINKGLKKTYLFLEAL